MSFWKGLKSGFKAFSHGITIIINTALLLVVYAIGVGITALVARAARKRFLDTRKGGKSYWEDLRIGTRPIENYYRQF